MNRTSRPRSAPSILPRLAIAFLCLGCGIAAAAPNGPRFGSATIGSEIRTAFGEEDEDVYVESLAAGETLQVRVAAAKKSALLPSFTIEGPDGRTRDVEVKTKKAGRLVQSARVPIDTTGRWVVRIRGDAGTEGAYAAKFKLGRQRSQTFRDVAVGGADGPNATQPFEAVEGAIASISVKSGKQGERATFALVVDPDGGSVAGSADRIKSKGAKASVKKLTLGDGDGAYGVVLTSPAGEAVVRVRVSLAPPRDRPRGKLTINPDEPFLTRGDEPLEGFAGKSFPLEGANLDTTPRPEVWFADRRGSVVSAGGGGATLSVVPPDFEAGTTVPVEVIAPDGQAARREFHFTYLEPEDDGPPPATLELTAITPPALTLDGDRDQVFEVTIDDDAPSGGVFVDLVATNGIGQIPPRIRIPTNGRSTSFLFRPVNANVAGAIRATLNTSVVNAQITVREVIDVPPPTADTIDVSGWSIQQQNSTRSFTIPQGTVLGKGDYVVLGRNATKAQFESTWGVTFGANVVYFNSVDVQVTEVPTINGSETYQLFDAFGASQDGPTIALSSSTRQNLQRAAGTDAGQFSSWNVQSSPNAAGNPGGGISASAANNGIYISEISDRDGAGQYVYEFVELYYDGEPE